MEEISLQISDFQKVLGKDPEREAAELMKLKPGLERFGLQLTKEKARELVLYKNESLKRNRRVEFGKGILGELMFEFCDSRYLDEDNWIEVLQKLQDIFYRFKNETEEQMTDEELLHCMKEQYETVCAGDIEYLADTCMERISRGVRGGRVRSRQQDGRGMYEQVDEEIRWDSNLYYQALHELL